MAARMARRVARNRKVQKRPTGKVQRVDLQKIVDAGRIPAQLLEEIIRKGTVRVMGLSGKAEFFRSKDGISITAQFTIGGRGVAKKFKASTGLAVNN